VLVDGQEVELTYKEYEILKHLMRNKGIVLTRDRLMEIVWGYNFEQGNRTVDVHIQSLRKKLGSAGEVIKTIRNVGYKVGD
jgi:two-component system alkaline phosphatase synthesis response regulator PhoP